MDTSTESVGSSDPATPKTVISPPDIDELRDQLSRIRNSAECFEFCNTIDAYSQDVDGFHFANLGLRNQFGVLIYSLLEQARGQYAVMKRSEMKYDMEEHNDILKQWGVSPTGEAAAFTPVVNRKQKSSSPRKDIAVAKKQKTEDRNMFSLLGVEELPDNFGEDQNPFWILIWNSTPAEPPHHSSSPSATSDNHRQRRTICKKLLKKKLQELTGQKLQGRVIGRGLRVYPETPAAYHQIRNLIDREKLRHTP
ncbi:hypothetical protein TNCV_191251 [Trichonephila clavipes]|nr:hypothetical protein TNCV_191251 [Trichonephila clavipes]